MKIGIFGGSFDPPHLGHLQIALLAKDHLGLDEVWFIPVFISPFKTNEPPVSPEHRLEMVKLLIEKYPYFKILDIEIINKRPSYTVDTLEFLKKNYPGDQFYLLLGQDSLEHFLSWKNPEEIVKMVKLAVAPRNSTLDLSFLKNHPEVYKEAVAGVLPMNLIPISSTEIRASLKSGGNPEKTVPKNILDYIHQHHLYFDENRQK